MAPAPAGKPGCGGALVPGALGGSMVGKCEDVGMGAEERMRVGIMPWSAEEEEEEETGFKKGRAAGPMASAACWVGILVRGGGCMELEAGIWGGVDDAVMAGKEFK